MIQSNLSLKVNLISKSTNIPWRALDKRSGVLSKGQSTRLKELTHSNKAEKQTLHLEQRNRHKLEPLLTTRTKIETK